MGSSLENNSKTPGAGTYEFANKTKASAPSYGFGTSKRVDPGVKKLNVPGPGGYKIPVTVADVPTYSMPNRNEEFKYV